MKPSTTDEIKGTFHEVKGKVKEKAGQVTNNPDLKAKGKAENIAGKVEKKVGQIEKVLREVNSGELCPEHAAFGTTDTPPISAQYCRDSADSQLGAERSVLKRAIPIDNTNQPLRRMNPRGCSR